MRIWRDGQRNNVHTLEFETIKVRKTSATNEGQRHIERSHRKAKTEICRRDFWQSCADKFPACFQEFSSPLLNSFTFEIAVVYRSALAYCPTGGVKRIRI